MSLEEPIQIKLEKLALEEYHDENDILVFNEWELKDFIEQLVEEVRKENTSKVTRVEVIDDAGRSYVNWKDSNRVELSFQDDDRTLKIFIDN